MKHALALILTCCTLCAQGTPPSAPLGLQPIANPNDERLKVFEELQAKATAGDTDALLKLGQYFYYGKFPVVKDPEKAKEVWIKGASLGSPNCAAEIETKLFDHESTDSEEVIERTKWFIIEQVLFGMKFNKGDLRYPTKRANVSESSFEEAKARATLFLTSVVTPNPIAKSTPKKGSGAVSDDSPGFRRTRVPGLKFESLALFDAHRKNVCSAYMKAAFPIYNKGEAASEEEKATFIATAAEIVKLQAYVGKSRRLSLSSKSNATLRAINTEKMNEFYSKMSAAKIATTLPATRAELNEASVYINNLSQLMQLPVTLGGDY